MSKPPPTGIYDLLNSSVLSGSNPSLTRSFIDGFRLRVRWIDIQPTSAASYNWAYIDNALTECDAHSKKLMVSINAGISTPDWVFDDAPTCTRFPVITSANGVPHDMPLGFETNYLNKWDVFVTAFGNRYDSNATIAAVWVTGYGQYAIERYITGNIPDRDAWATAATNAGFLSASAALRFASAHVIDKFVSVFPTTPTILNGGSPWYPGGGAADAAWMDAYMIGKPDNLRGLATSYLKAITTANQSGIGMILPYPKGDQPIGESQDTSYSFYSDQSRPYAADPQPVYDLIQRAYEVGDKYCEIYEEDINRAGNVNDATITSQRAKLISNYTPGGPNAPFFLFVSPVGGGTFASDGTSADVQAKINLASTGDTVTLPSGSFTWTSGVTCNKAIKIQGQGSGRIIGQSTDTVAIGTGAKSFTVQSGLAITAGQTLRIHKTGFLTTFMEGTVTSYSGTSLVMNITSTGGSGSPHLWVVCTNPATTVTHTVAAAPSFTLTESTAGAIEFSGIKVVYSSGNLSVIDLNYTSGGTPCLFHDCWFVNKNNGESMIRAATHRGILWNCSFENSWEISGQAGSGITFADTTNATGSWTSNHTMGTADTSGRNNFYIEDSDFHAYLNAFDMSDGARTVIRHNLFNNAGMGTHGPDSAVYGNRHFEVYNNTFTYNGYSDGSTLNLNWWLFLRGGTGIWTDNVQPLINSTDYPNQATYKFTVMALRRDGSMQPAYACWSGGYPLPREIGQGYINGSAATEPIYIWNNTGTAGSATPSMSDTDCGDGEACVNCATQPTTASFIQSGRDYFLSAKSGYTKYSYPHPLRT